MEELVLSSKTLMRYQVEKNDLVIYVTDDGYSKYDGYDFLDLANYLTIVSQ